MKINKNGFSLVELLVVMAIMGILVALILVGVQRVKIAGRKVQCASNLHQLWFALESFKADNHGYYPVGRDQIWAGGLNYESRLSQYLSTSPKAADANPDNPMLEFYEVGAGSVWWVCEQRLKQKYLCPEVVRMYPDYPYVMGYAYNDTVIRNDGATTPLPVTSEEQSPALILVPNPGAKIIMFCNAQGGIWAYAAQRWSLFNKGLANPTDFDTPPGFTHYMINPPFGIHGGTENYLFCDGHIESIKPIERNRIDRAWFEGLPVTDPFPMSGRANPWNDPDYVEP